MREASSQPPVQHDRRSEPGLRFDPIAGLLSLGTAAVDIAPTAGNRAILEAYVELAASCRGDQLTDLVEVRHADLEALAIALDLDADDLASQVEEVLGASSEQAVRFVARLRENRVVSGIAKIAAGAALAGGLLAGAGAVSASARPETTPVVATTTTATPGATPSSGDPATTTTTDATAAGGWVSDDEPVIDGPLTTTPDGVGLIPPITEDASGAVLVPPASADRQDPAGS